MGKTAALPSGCRPGGSGPARCAACVALLLAVRTVGGAMPDTAQMEIRLTGAGHPAPQGQERSFTVRLARVRGAWDPVLLEPDGRVLSAEGDDSRLQVKILYTSDAIPGQESGDWGRCSVDLLRTADGSYGGKWAGTWNGTEQSGAATAVVEIYPGVSGFVAPQPGEHPRFLFRRSELPALRKKAQTPWGQAMGERLRAIAQTESKSDPDVTTHRAVALGLLYQLTGDRAWADRARALVEGDIATWYNIHFVHGAAVRTLQGAYAYDLIAETCDETFRARMRRVFLRKCRYLYSPPVGGFNPSDASNWAAMYRSAMGMSALTVLAGPAVGGAGPAQPPALVEVSAVPLFQGPEGVPVVEAAGGRGVTNWLVAGPFDVEAGTDPLGALGGAGAARPVVGTAVAYKKRDGSQGTCAFAPMDPQHRVSEKRAADLKRPDLAGTPELAAMAGRRYLTTLCLYAAVRVAKDGCYRFDFPRTHMEDVALYLGGRQVAPGAVARVQAGTHPLMAVAAIGVCGNWETMELPFRVSAVTEAAAAEWLARKRRRYDYETAIRAADAERVGAAAVTDTEAARWLCVAERRTANWPERALGERGWNGEGEGYTQHAMRLVLPFAHAFQNVTGRSLTAEPNLGMAFVLYVNKTVYRENGVAMPSYGPGGGPLGVDNWARGFGFVPDRYRGVALWGWNRTQTMAEAGTFQEPNGVVAALDGLSAAFRFVNYPVDAAGGGLQEQDPDGALERAVTDRKKGGFVMRNRWQDGDDCVATVFLDSEVGGGGWRGPDWGDIRLSGLGADWAVRGIPWGNGVSTRKPLPDGTLPDARQHGSVVIVPGTVLFGSKSGGGNRGAGLRAPFGTVTAWSFAEDGSGIVQADLSNGYVRLTGEKVPMARMVAVDYSGASGTPCLMAVADRMSGTDGTNVWQFCTESGHAVKTEGNVFTIAAKNGATLQGTVVMPESAKIAFEPVSFRHEVNYHGRHSQAEFRRTLIRVTGAENPPRPSGHPSGGGDRAGFGGPGTREGVFFVVMTVQKGAPPPVTAERHAREVRAAVGRQRVSLDEKGIHLAPFARAGGL